MQTWEYRTFTMEAEGWLLGGKIDAQGFTDKLNAMGRDGWELVSVFDTNMYEGRTRSVVAVLKRPS